MTHATRIKMGLFATLITLGLAACEFVEMQRPEESFADKRLPEMLEKLANQKFDLLARPGLAERVKADQARTDLLRVAVIDCGVDIAHADLVNQIAYNIENGRISGAGFDVMGNDAWASPNLVKPSLFAFGARGLEQGKIVGPPENPLDLMLKIELDFQKALKQALEQDPVLKASLFRQLGPDSIDVFGAYRLLINRSEVLETYATSEQSESLYFDGMRPIQAKKPINARETDVDMYLFLDRPWQLQPENGLPSLGSGGNDSDVAQLSIVKGAPQLLTALEKIFNDLDGRYGFKAAVENYLAFTQDRTTNTGRSRVDSLSQALTDLNKALLFKRFGPRFSDPLFDLERSIDQTLLEAFSQSRTGRDLRSEVTVEKRRAIVQKALEVYPRYLSFIDSIPDKTIDQVRATRQLKDNWTATKQLMTWYLEERNWSSIASSAPNLPTAQASLYRRYLLQTAHPFVASQSAEQAHGTHVSGIIAKQDPNIRIVPVRVTTQSVSMGKAQGEQIRQAFAGQFRDWMAEPVVFPALGKLLARHLPDLNFNDDTPANRARVAAKIMQILDERLRLSFESSSIDYVFMGEIEQAIEYVGKNKIKIANISLGTSFESVPTSFENKSPTQETEALFDFLRYEFFKFRVAQVVATKAPGTLFVVATGNDGKWVDGRARSALPVDLTSQFLREFEDPKKGRVAPNNHLENVLAVGSMGPKNEISSYTNIPIGLRTPFVLAHGENILSPVKTTDTSSVKQLFKAEFSDEMLTPLSFRDDRLLPFLEKEGLLKPNAGPTAQEVAQRTWGNMSTILLMANQNMQLHTYLRFPEHRARMSGTSMATPTTSGLMATLLLKMAKEKGLSPEQYDRPDFAPKAMIEALFRTAVPYGDLTAGIDLKMLLKDKTWEGGSRAQELDQLIAKARRGETLPKSPAGPAPRDRAQLSGGAVQCRSVFAL